MYDLKYTFYVIWDRCERHDYYNKMKHGRSDVIGAALTCIRIATSAYLIRGTLIIRVRGSDC